MFILNIQTHAYVSCSNNSNSQLYPGNIGNHISFNIISSSNTFRYQHGSDLVSDALISCQLDAANYKNRTSNFYPFISSNISNTDPKTLGLKIFSKISNTSSVFLNQHAWIYFFYKDPLSTGLGRWIGTADAPLYISTSSSKVPSQGILLYDFEIYLDEIPTQKIENVTVKLGKLTTYVSDNSTSKLYEAFPQIILNMTPNLAKTCNVSNANVQLPTILTSKLNNIGDQAELRDFSIVVNCTSDLKNTALSFSLNDNFLPTNTTDVISNDNSESNVGIRMYDALSNQPIKMTQVLPFGTLDSVSSAITKNFYARYYKHNSLPTVAGTVNSQVTLTISYQ
ncbi:fimbrial protein [Acinetobacter sp. 187]|uniref:fimbrial protein n=1 Tax=Acinetobacter lanii TaxID=2715163 RepID=UPI00140ADE3C|nr:fimbrial protein [Acinetobacter lanii]NHC03427.1 fimbrial protein [Acinetobacter lanii]